MRWALGNLLLGLAWLALTGSFTIANFAMGLVVGLATLWVLGNTLGTHEYPRRWLAAGRLVVTMGWEVTAATARIAVDVVTPRIRATPAIFAVELEERSDIELLLLSILVTLTPGSVVVHLTEDRRRLYVYGMYVPDADEYRQRIARTFDRRILDVTRGPGREPA